MVIGGSGRADAARGVEGCDSLVSLPGLPFTERFGPYRPRAELSADQEVLISTSTGLVQLRHQVDPAALYSSDVYSFRTAASDRPTNSARTFVSFLDRVVGGQRFASAVDIGGNDLTLARLLLPRCDRVAVIDPVCRAIDGAFVDGISVIGQQIEDIDLRDAALSPDLIICQHTLEHVASPINVVQQLLDQANDECVVVFEIPDIDRLVESLRFDAIIHQHYSYFNLATLTNLVEGCGAERLTWAVNHRGSCGGSLLAAFKKGATRSASKVDITAEVERTSAAFLSRFDLFHRQMEVMSQLIRELPKPVYGYGASLMLATLDYHLDTDFSELECILDDDPGKDGMTYENVPVTVRHPDSIRVNAESSFVVTSPENVRVLESKIYSLDGRHCLSPILT